MRNRFKNVHLRKSYKGTKLEELVCYHENLKKYYYSKSKDNEHVDEIYSQIFSSRKLLSGEEGEVICELAKNVDVVDLCVENFDDWAFSKRFVGSLFGLIGKTKLRIIYATSRDIHKAKERLEKGNKEILEYIERDTGYYICWKFEDKYLLYGLPQLKGAIDEHTKCVIIDYYLLKIQ